MLLWTTAREQRAQRRRWRSKKNKIDRIQERERWRREAPSGKELAKAVRVWLTGGEGSEKREKGKKRREGVEVG